MAENGIYFIESAVSDEAFLEIIRNLDLRPPVIIKPNWGFSVCFTEAKIIDAVLSAVDGDAIIVESYGWARSREALEDGSWGSFEVKDLRENDRWFLEYSGIGRILAKYDVEYLNITEQYWADCMTDSRVVKGIFETLRPPLEREEFYSFVPQRLFDMRGCDFLSLAKVRVMEEPIHVSLSVKNFFGMIPGPSRGMYHGENHKLLNQSIVDIYQLYDALFNVKAIVEALITASIRNTETMAWETIGNPGFASSAESPVQLDACVTSSLGINLDDVGYLKLAISADHKADLAIEESMKISWGFLGED